MTAAKTTMIHVDNVTCGSCIRHIKQAISQEPGVSEVDVELAPGKSGLVTVKFEDGKSSPQSFIESLATSGYVGRIVSA